MPVDVRLKRSKLQKNWRTNCSSTTEFEFEQGLWLSERLIFFGASNTTEVWQKNTSEAVDSERPHPDFGFCPAAKTLVICSSEQAITQASAFTFKLKSLHNRPAMKELTVCSEVKVCWLLRRPPREIQNMAQKQKGGEKQMCLFCAPSITMVTFCNGNVFDIALNGFFFFRKLGTVIVLIRVTEGLCFSATISTYSSLTSPSGDLKSEVRWR